MVRAASNASNASPPSSTAFAISLRELDGHTSVLTVAGELDLCSAPTFKWALTDVLSLGCSELVVDLSPVTFIDSTALSVLIGVQRRLRSGTRLTLVCANAKVLEIMEMTGLVAMFELFSTLEHALAGARGDATAAT
jgi:anti-sigma B factor antagonist